MLDFGIVAEEPKFLVGRIESVDRHTDKPLSRYTFVVDAVDGSIDFDATKKPANKLPHGTFALARIMTTPRRFAQLTENIDGTDTPEDWVGQWVGLSLVPYREIPGPLTQVCPLGETGYNEVIKYTLESITVFGSQPDFPKSLGAAGNGGKQLASSFAAAGSMFDADTKGQELRALRRRLMWQKPNKIRIYDVGHANFVSVLSSSGDPILHFDAGWPVGFNYRTYPPNSPSVKPADIVVLSHWDWDHLHGYHKWAHLRKSTWVTPVQNLGPGALRVAEQLKASNLLISIGPNSKWAGSIFSTRRMRLTDANPRHATTRSEIRNNTGLILSVILNSWRSALLPGDANYDSANWAGFRNPDLLVVSHHGAVVKGAIQAPNSNGSDAVVSLGLGNVYRHPCTKTLQNHSVAGWKLTTTCASKHLRRGDRDLT